jgi:hypothetical protein
LSECERYNCEERLWEELPQLPEECSGQGAFVLDNRLYSLGGWNYDRLLDTVQMLSLDTLTWELLQLKLPQEARYFPCFKTDTQAYLVINKTLYCFTPQQVKPIKKLRKCISCETSYYSRGTLYYESMGAKIKSLAIEELA